MKQGDAKQGDTKQGATEEREAEKRPVSLIEMIAQTRRDKERLAERKRRAEKPDKSAKGRGRGDRQRDPEAEEKLSKRAKLVEEQFDQISGLRTTFKIPKKTKENQFRQFRKAADSLSSKDRRPEAPAEEPQYTPEEVAINENDYQFVDDFQPDADPEPQAPSSSHAAKAQDASTSQQEQRERFAELKPQLEGRFVRAGAPERLAPAQTAFPNYSDPLQRARPAEPLEDLRAHQPQPDFRARAENLNKMLQSTFAEFTSKIDKSSRFKGFEAKKSAPVSDQFVRRGATSARKDADDLEDESGDDAEPPTARSKQEVRADLSANRRFPDVNSRLPDVSNRFPDVSNRFPDVNSRLPDVSSRLPDVSSRLPQTPQRKVADALPNLNKVLGNQHFLKNLD